MDLSVIKNAASEESLEFATKMVNELREDLKRSFKRLSDQNGVTEDKVQLALRFRDGAGGTGEMFYQLMIGWKPLREANFNRDVLGIEGKMALYPDDTGKEAFIRMYVLGMPQLKIEGMFTTIAKQHNVTRWSDVSGIFYKKTPEEQIKLGIFLPVDGKNKKVETVDLFEVEENPATDTAGAQQQQNEKVISESGLTPPIGDLGDGKDEKGFQG